MSKSKFLIFGYFTLVIGVFFALGRYHNAELESRNAKVEEYSRLFAHYLWTINDTEAQDFLKVISSDSRISSVHVVHRDGRPFVGFEREPSGLILPTQLVQRTISRPVLWQGAQIGSLSVRGVTYDTAIDFYAGTILLVLAAALTYYLSYLSKQSEFEELSRRAAAIFTNTSEAIFLSDVHGTIQSVNPAFEQTTGYKQADIAGKNSMVLVSLRHSQEFALSWWESMLRGGQWQGEFWLRRKDGSDIPISTSVSRIPSQDGKQELFTAMFRDITDRKEAEAGLLEAKERLAEAENLAHLGSWAWDLKTGEIWSSDELCQILGVDSSTHSFEARPFLTFVHPNDHQMARQATLSCITDNKPLHGIFRIIRDDGAIRTVETASRFVSQTNDHSSRLVGFLHDITELAQNQEALQLAKDEAEQASLAKSKFLAAASHDLRQPLQALSMFVAALGDSIHSGGLEEKNKQTRLIGNVENSIEALAGLLNSLLDISRLDAGIMEPVEQDFSISQTLEWVRNTFREEARQRNVQFTVLPCHATIKTDPNLFKRIAGNLVSNAVRYTPKGKVLVGCKRSGDNLRLEVWDTGGGIPEDKMELVFQEFQQLENPGRQRERGLGLGLAIVERVAKLLDHPLSARSILGKGSVFTVEVPITSWESAAATTAPFSLDEPIGDTPQRILVIDDDPAVLDGMAALMEVWGFDVSSAPSAEAALRESRNQKFPLDLIVADYRLQEEETGADTIHRINRELGWSVPGIIITGDTAPERLQEAAASGFALLHKPVQPDVLKKLVDKMLNT